MLSPLLRLPLLLLLPSGGDASSSASKLTTGAYGSGWLSDELLLGSSSRRDVTATCRQQGKGLAQYEQ
jgi:hypothetical protein